jgi:protein-S-isoprenylcysteine O-methyltransferase Ste14
LKLELKVPPPLQALIIGVLMWVVARRLQGGQLDIAARLPWAILLATAGMAVVVSAMLRFRRSSTTVDPFHPEEASHLVVDGIFRFSRNPMYVSLLLVLSGWVIWLGSIYNLVLLAIFVWYISIFQIKPEEEALTSLFGEEYRHYCSSVRRWI